MSPAQTTVIIRRARPEDRVRVEELLASEKLPTAGVGEHFENYLVAVTAQGLAGTIGLERYGENGLLRSAVVVSGARDRGLGALLTARLIEHARSHGVRRLYLLTTTAADYFERLGFRGIARSDLPRELADSEELRGACPDDAVCMEKDLA